jgi:hypothetical protein
MSVGSNQTSKDSLAKFQENNEHLGTGFFAVADPEKGILELRVLEVVDLSYLECCKRGQNCFYFKWIPQLTVVDNLEAIVELRAPGFRGTCMCDDDCPQGYICDKQTFRCI